MKNFTRLIERISGSDKATGSTVEALEVYLKASSSKDCLIMLSILTGISKYRIFSLTEIKILAIEMTHVPEWLFNESYKVCGDINETISLIIPHKSEIQEYSLEEIVTNIDSLRHKDRLGQKNILFELWRELNGEQIFLLNKLVTGTLRKRVPLSDVHVAVARHYHKEPFEIAQLLENNWNVDMDSLDQMILSHSSKDLVSLKRSFREIIHSSPENNPKPDFSRKSIQYKYDGISCLFIWQQNKLILWTKYHEIITNKISEIDSLILDSSVDFTIEGELVAFHGKSPISVEFLQSGLKRKNIRNSAPDQFSIRFITNDIYNYNGKDLTKLNYDRRRTLMQDLISEIDPNQSFMVESREFRCVDFLQAEIIRRSSRDHQAMGLLIIDTYPLKQAQQDIPAVFWKADSLNFIVALTYVTIGQGSSSGRYNEFTFGARNESDLMTIAKAKSLNTNETERINIEEYISGNIMEKFGPVRRIKPGMIFKIECSAVQPSKRHKSGVLLKDVSVINWERELTIAEINSTNSILKFAHPNDNPNN